MALGDDQQLTRSQTTLISDGEGLSSFDDPKVTTLNVIPAKDYASSSTNNFLEVEVLAVLTDGSDTKTETVKPLDLSTHTPFIGENLNMSYPPTRKNKT